ncbi:hypothetical protein [Microseira sp. BLCC-F43]|jgi:hypothetical protein|uniref:hypothetical protein n=1 Tax=Microseira sp. BLCC-F43 TaxID=3153602 RepID=UPI0035B9EA8F
MADDMGISSFHPKRVEVEKDGFHLEFATAEEAKECFGQGAIRGHVVEMLNYFTVVIKFRKVSSDTSPQD